MPGATKSKDEVRSSSEFKTLTKHTETHNIWNISFYNILWAELAHDNLIINYALPSKEEVIPATLRYPVHYLHQQMEEWIETLLESSYRDSQRKKRIKILVNPSSGQGNARRLYAKRIEPLLRAAGCIFDSVETKYPGEGSSIAETLDIDAFDAIAICSGDGLAHEVFNGLGKRPDVSKALSKIAIAHIPCGSGNGLSHNLNGTGVVSQATLAIIKGVRRPLDLVSITQGHERTLSFLSQATGMGAESDLATEYLRWMRDVRFKIGFLTRILTQRVYPADIAVKIAIDTKSSILDHYEKELLKSNPENPQLNTSQVLESDSDNVNKDRLPPLKYGTIKDDVPSDWVTIPCDNLGILYCGNLAYVGANAKFFAAALPNDGMMDLLLLDGNLSRCTLLRTFGAVKNETFFDLPAVRYRKILAYRWAPRGQSSGYLSVDGEKKPFEPYQAEVHQGLGTVITKNHQIPGALSSS
ncbi:Sphingoid long chain base kinase 5 [Phlyctema vagabunda]|uniref:Sphingoid long chain base kinase 5 n=1 Tax=Phlyctema vagabunda TaxID=108571 RepID=A0ABR4PCX9_9HELO